MPVIINSVKHFVNRTDTQISAGAIANLTMAEAKVAPASAATLEVKEGSVIKAVHVEMWLMGNQGVDSSCMFIVTIEKIPANATGMTVTNSANLQSYLNKKNILFTSQGIIPGNINAGPSTPIIREWVLIPKGKQRMGLGDKLVINVHAVASNMRTCGMFIYKEYY